VYAVTFDDGVWTLLQGSPDFTPLDFSRRFTGEFSADGNTIRGRWKNSNDGSSWEHDFGPHLPKGSLAKPLCVSRMTLPSTGHDSQNGQCASGICAG